MLKRCLDIFFALGGLILLLPVFALLSLWVILDSRGSVFYRQIRVGRGGLDFKLLKFRTMRSGAEKQGLLTVGNADSRITRAGYYLRKYKLDELPQLFNVLQGDMSLVGPRPEVRKYVDMYTVEQRKILSLRPGITDYASIEYSKESEILAGASDPEKLYIEEIMSAKIRLNEKYMREQGVLTDLKIILRTFLKIIS
jgi:lipopolysaccharide/colanic/teichoic acid biosynthesis glycosyltransferase